MEHLGNVFAVKACAFQLAVCLDNSFHISRHAIVDVDQSIDYFIPSVGYVLAVFRKGVLGVVVIRRLEIERSFGGIGDKTMPALKCPDSSLPSFLTVLNNALILGLLLSCSFLLRSLLIS